VILLEPFFQYFFFNAKMSGATVKTCEMIPKDGDWVLDFAKFESLFTKKTKLLIINSPHNPTGKVFTKEEVSKIHEILKKFPDVLVLADEVYEKCVYDNADFPRIGTIEELWPRSITIMSSGKVLIFNK
jgi:aspartate/methionine/tyrosine aminotransferase